MGLIIYPFLLINIIFVFWAIFYTIKSMSKKQFTISHLLTGIAVTIITYGILYLDYRLSDKAYPLGTYFMFPFFMVSIPFFIGLCARFVSGRIAQFLSMMCLFSSIFSGLFIAIFQKYTFYIIDFLQIPKYY